MIQLVFNNMANVSTSRRNYHVSGVQLIIQGSAISLRLLQWSMK